MFVGPWSGREMTDLFGTLGDSAEVTFLGTLGDEMGVDAFSGRVF